jgi:hypothetical protein
MKTLSREEIDYLRIEKIGKYYAVRLGKFEDRAHAERFHKTIKRDLNFSILMKAYIKDERIMKLRSHSPLSDSTKPPIHRIEHGA